MEKDQQQISLEREALEHAHKMYDDQMFCPKCGTLLSGLHMMGNCYNGFIRKQAEKYIKAKR